MKEETMKLLEEVIVKDLEYLSDYDPEDEDSKELAKVTKSRVCDLLDKLNTAERTQSEFWDKEERREMDKAKNEAMVELEKKKLETNEQLESKKIGYDFVDKNDRRKIEREKISANQKVEEMKQSTPKWKAILETAKILVPVMVPIIAYNVFQERVLKFEETGRITSTAGRDLHLPRFMK